MRIKHQLQEFIIQMMQQMHGVQQPPHPPHPGVRNLAFQKFYKMNPHEFEGSHKPHIS